MPAECPEEIGARAVQFERTAPQRDIAWLLPEAVLDQRKAPREPLKGQLGLAAVHGE